MSTSHNASETRLSVIRILMILWMAAIGAKLGVPGLRFVNEMRRFDVSGATAAHLLGFVDVDERGVGGIELSYDRLIRGQGGRLLLDVDALNKSYDHSVEEPVPGADVALT